jgi:hypothetical protein
MNNMLDPDNKTHEAILSKIQAWEQQGSSTPEPEIMETLHSNSHNEENLLREVQRATQQLLPDKLRDVYHQLNTNGYVNYIEQMQGTTDVETTIELEDLWKDEEKQLQPPSSARTYRTNQSFQSTGLASSSTLHRSRMPCATTRSKKKEDALQKKKRLVVQNRNMQKRRAIEKQIRAQSLARFAMRKTTRKKMIT